jgi:hypothetical protein
MDGILTGAGETNLGDERIVESGRTRLSKCRDCTRQAWMSGQVVNGFSVLPEDIEVVSLQKRLNLTRPRQRYV